MSISNIQQYQAHRTVFKVFGVGGGGSNAITRLYENTDPEILQQIICMVSNTDAQHLEKCTELAQDLTECAELTKIQLGPDLTKGLGAGSKPSVGKDAADESRKEIESYLEGTDILIIAACLGGGTGTGAAPVIAEIAKGMEILTLAIVTMPFQLEGSIRSNNAMIGLQELEQYVNTLLVVHNENLLSLYKQNKANVSFQEVLYHADEVLRHGVDAITGLIYKKQIVKVDFADLRASLLTGGRAIIGIGESSGANASTEAPQQALNSPLLGRKDIHGAKSLIVHVTLGKGGSMEKAREASQYVIDQVKTQKQQNVNVKWGFQIQDDCSEETIRVTLIAVGLEEDSNKQQSSQVTASSQKTVKPTMNRSLGNIFDNSNFIKHHEVVQPKPPTLHAAEQPATQNDIAHQANTKYQRKAPRYSDLSLEELEEPSLSRR